jgi:hypothetical protein
MVDQKHNEMTIVLKVLAAMVVISLVSAFVSLSGAGNTTLACTASTSTAAGCSYKTAVWDVNETYQNLIHSMNNATATPIGLIPYNASDTFGVFRLIGNSFIAIPNIFAHIFGWYDTTNGTFQGFFFNVLLLIGDLFYIVGDIVFFIIPSVIYNIGAGSGLSYITTILSIIELFTAGMVIVVGVYIIANRIWGGGG